MIKINKWNDTFENADSRKRQRLGWYYTPSGNDSAGYRKLMRNGTDGVIALGFFNSLCQHMATLKREIRINGVFCNNDGSIMDIEDISEVTRISVADIQHACGMLVACGWITLDTTTICQSSATNLPLSADDLPTLCKEKEKEKEKEKKKEKKNGFQPPAYGEFEKYLKETLPKINPEWSVDRINRASQLQFQNYEESDSNPMVWRDGNGKLVKSWKITARNALKFHKPWNYGGNGKSSVNSSLQNTNQY